MRRSLLALLASAQTFPRAAELDAAHQTRRSARTKFPAPWCCRPQGQVVYRKAYGYRALVPAKEPMTADTIFDIASLTKIVATTSGMMKLFEQGAFALDDPVTKYLPEFQGGESPITIRDLMTHFSGLRPDLDLEPAWSGYETGIRRRSPISPPARRTRNSFTAISISSCWAKSSTG